MKCWICGKEESTPEVKVNMERLIGAVQEAFEMAKVTQRGANRSRRELL